MDNKDKILYLTENYIHSPVHHNLCNSICQYHYDIIVLSIQRLIGQSKDISSYFKNRLYDFKIIPLNASEVLYKYILLYKFKIKYARITSNIDLREIKIIHAGTLFSDGAVAYKLHKKFGIKYIITVRATDVYFYLKTFPFLVYLAKKIINNASQIIFITPVLKDTLCSYKGVKKILNSKSSIIPNGIDNISSTISKRSNFDNTILYIGRFDKNKNVHTLIKVFSILKEKNPLLKLILIGGGGDYSTEIEKMISSIDGIEFLGEIRDKVKLNEIFKINSIFVMISKYETFGLVYIEALLNGIPIIYTENQGFDGFFESGKIGFAVNPKNEEDIVQKIDYLSKYYTEFNERIQETDLTKFQWDNIARQYINIYNNVKADL